MFDREVDIDGGKPASQAYWNALNKLRVAWKEVFEEDLPTIGNHAMGAFEQALELVKFRLTNDPTGANRLRYVLDVDADEEIPDALLRWADVDDIPPNVLRRAIQSQAHVLGKGRHDLRALLRPVLDVVFAKSSARRPHYGANRHWPRLLQYLRELEEETDWSPAGRGLRLVNAGGRGPVAFKPTDPRTLAVWIDPDFL